MTILKYLDRSWHCRMCDTHQIPESEIQMVLGKCPICGESEWMTQDGAVIIYAKKTEHYNRKMDKTYFTTEPYYPSEEEKRRLRCYEVMTINRCA